MKIKMIGIDYQTAALAEREIFVFTPVQAQSAMQYIVQNPGVNGAVLISTCNRTELWISEKDGQEIDLREALCELKEVSLGKYQSLLTAREGLEAVRHLFETACGFNSQLWGEDQILAQIKSAIEYARTADTTDQTLEKLFQTAITAAKRIKTEVRLTSADVSMATGALEMVKKHFPTLNGLECLVIGNGEMGRMVSALLVDCGAKVMVTRRKYKNGSSFIPCGCTAIDYESRTEKIKEAELIFSATSSPHYTIRADDIKGILKDHRPRMFIDLAVPRDIDPALSGWPNVTLLDSDRLGRSSPAEVCTDAFVRAQEIIDESIEEFMLWSKARDLIPVINGIAVSTSEKIRKKLSREIEDLRLDKEQRNLFEQKLVGVAAQAVRNILFQLKDSMDDDDWKECFGNMVKQ